MNLFGNRPLALISATAIFVSFFAHKASATLKIFMLALALILFIIALLISHKSSKRKMGAMLVSLCAVGAILAASVQLFAVDVKAHRARALEGDKYCELLIIEENDSTTLRSYKSVLRDVDGRSVSFDAELYLFFDGELRAGDVVRVRGSVAEAGSMYGTNNEWSDLDVFVYDSGSCVLVSEGNFSPRILFASMRGRVAEYMRATFGEECGALARGIFLGDTDGIEKSLIRDFRRSGVSHLLAVSGLHISMLVAMVELMLLRLSLGRRVRCMVISVLSIIFLGMTGFAMSACRSVFMLLFVYLHYLFARESDSLTALFASVAAIMLISPSSAVDVGLWLSFLATLGIISVYVPMSKHIKIPRKPGVWAGVFRILKNTALAILLCFVCNVFTAIVVFCVFGEVSAMAFISNLVLTPLALLFLITIPVGLAFVNLGVVGDAIVFLARSISQLIEYLCGVFSGVGGAVISLGYGFAGVIIVAMSISLAVMLVINMKHKMLVLAPPIAAVAAFAVCLSVYNAINADKLAISYRRERSDEMIFMSECSGVSVIDISFGAYSFLGEARSLARQSYATEIDDLVLTHYHDAHPASIELVCERMMLGRIYLPTPTDEAEWRIARRIAEIAERYGCLTVEYASGDTLILTSDARVRVDMGDEGEIAVFVANEKEALTYIGDGVRESEGSERFSSLADYIIFGVHGGDPAEDLEKSENREFILH